MTTLLRHQLHVAICNILLKKILLKNFFATKHPLPRQEILSARQLHEQRPNRRLPQLHDQRPNRTLVCFRPIAFVLLSTR